MSESPRSNPGSIVWPDLTVADAPGVRDFYRAVVGVRSTGADRHCAVRDPAGAVFTLYEKASP